MADERWRVIENPDDGTSQWRARVVHGEGLSTTIRAMFVDAEVAADYAAVLNAIDGVSVAAHVAALESRLRLAEEDATALAKALNGMTGRPGCWCKRAGETAT